MGFAGVSLSHEMQLSFEEPGSYSKRVPGNLPELAPQGFRPDGRSTYRRWFDKERLAVSTYKICILRRLVTMCEFGYADVQLQLVANRCLLACGRTREEAPA